MRNRVLILGAAAFIGIVAACSDSNDSSGASAVALLVNPNFASYDTSSQYNEASEMEFTLASFGVTIDQVTAVDSASLDAALSANQAFVIPEDGGSAFLPDSLTAGALAVIRDFVDSAGGTLILIGDNAAQTLLDSLWGYQLANGVNQTSYALDATAAGGTGFAGGPGTVLDNDGTYVTDAASLPVGAEAIYANGTDVAVIYIPQGRGAVVILGWDWYNAEPHGSQDNGWVDVLRRALRS